MSPAAALFWISVVCCAIAQVLIVRSVLAVRGADADAGLPRSHRATEVFWALLPAVALGALLLFTWRTIELREASRAPSGVDAPR
jgi:hypothetical protein